MSADQKKKKSTTIVSLDGDLYIAIIKPSIVLRVDSGGSTQLMLKCTGTTLHFPLESIGRCNLVEPTLADAWTNWG